MNIPAAAAATQAAATQRRANTRLRGLSTGTASNLRAAPHLAVSNPDRIAGAAYRAGLRLPISLRRSRGRWWRRPDRCVRRPAAIVGDAPLCVLVGLFGLLAQRFSSGDVSEQRDRVPQQRGDAPPPEEQIVQLCLGDCGVALRVPARDCATLVVPKDQAPCVFGDRDLKDRFHRRRWWRPAGSTGCVVSAATGWIHATILSRSGLFVHCTLRDPVATRRQLRLGYLVIVAPPNAGDRGAHPADSEVFRLGALEPSVIYRPGADTKRESSR
jgi:hypothetical protein